MMHLELEVLNVNLSHRGRRDTDRDNSSTPGLTRRPPVGQRDPAAPRHVGARRPGRPQGPHRGRGRRFHQVRSEPCSFGSTGTSRPGTAEQPAQRPWRRRPGFGGRGAGAASLGHVTARGNVEIWITRRKFTKFADTFCHIQVYRISKVHQEYATEFNTSDNWIERRG